jgi:hypothetical protein
MTHLIVIELVIVGLNSCAPLLVIFLNFGNSCRRGNSKSPGTFVTSAVVGRNSGNQYFVSLVLTLYHVKFYVTQ